jgi:hypothetical protein
MQNVEPSISVTESGTAGLTGAPLNDQGCVTLTPPTLTAVDACAYAR